MPCFKQSVACTIASKPASAASKPKGAAKPVSVDEMIKLAIADLIRRKTARPRTPKTLRSTIHARCGKEVPAADIDAVYEALVERGYVKLDGAKVTYWAASGLIRRMVWSIFTQTNNLPHKKKASRAKPKSYPQGCPQKM